jgi:uncharacterized protein YjiS (DUF1127 family)
MSMLEQAPASAAAGKGELLSNFGLLALLRKAASITGAWRGRKVVMRLRDFDDAQLADIGLKRSDVETALLSPLNSDPTRLLVRARHDPLRGTKHF